MKCVQCSGAFNKSDLNKVTHIENILLCHDCVAKNIGAEPSLDLFLLELNLITADNLPLGMGERAAYLFLKKYKRYLPVIDFALEPSEAIRAFIKAFRQTDCVPDNPKDGDESVPLDIIGWCLLNEYNALLSKAFRRIVSKKSVFQEESI